MEYKLEKQLLNRLENDLNIGQNDDFIGEWF